MSWRVLLRHCRLASHDVNLLHTCKTLLSQPVTAASHLELPPAALLARGGPSARGCGARSYSTSAAADTKGDVLHGVLLEQLAAIRDAGTFKEERIITTAQGAEVRVLAGAAGDVTNFCANNYLGLANHPRLVAAAKQSLDTHGFGLASVRFICGTQDLHKELEAKISAFHGTDDTILFPSCFDANGGLFESILTADDAVISDELNHASIIDGIRLCKAQRHRFRHADMADLEAKLKETQGARVRLIATDGVFSMDGDVAPLAEICQLARAYGALVFVDDCHATGFFGPTGRGTDEFCGVHGQVDIINSTLGKALGGATGGYSTGRQDVIDVLRQRARPYLFSNSLAPAVAAASIAAFELLMESTALRDRLERNTDHFRRAMAAAGFAIRPGRHPIVPIMLGDARVAHDMARRLLDRGVYVVGFSYPVVPKGKARIRVQLSAAHTQKHLDDAISAFTHVGRDMGIIS